LVAERWTQLPSIPGRKNSDSHPTANYSEHSLVIRENVTIPQINAKIS